MNSKKFEAFYKKNFKKAVKIIKKMGIQNAEDVVQDTFLYVLKRPDLFTKEKFFYYMLLRKGYDELRRLHVKQKWGF